MNVDSVGSIFKQMKKSRATQTLYESETEAPFSTSSDELDESIDDSCFSVVTCNDCGAVVSSLDEAGDGCPCCGSHDLSEKTVKVVREGKVVRKNVRTRKVRLTPAQKAALKKARKKAHTGAANRKRAKSMKVRTRKGMNEEEELLVCPECGFEGTPDDYDYEDGVYICPECGAEVE